MPTSANNPITVPATPEASYSDVRMSRMTISWTEADGKASCTYTVKKSAIQLDGSYIDAPANFVDGAGKKASKSKSIPDLFAYAASKAAAGDTSYANAINTIVQLAVNDATADGDF